MWKPCTSVVQTPAFGNHSLIHLFGKPAHLDQSDADSGNQDVVGLIP